MDFCPLSALLLLLLLICIVQAQVSDPKPLVNSDQTTETEVADSETEQPKATLSLQHDWTEFFIGETVTLKCVIPEYGSSEWTYNWYKKGDGDNPVHSAEGSGGKKDSDSNQYIISHVEESDAGEYTCRGTETGASRYSHTSDAVRLTVSVRPKPSVTVQPQSSVYTGDIVTLSCNIQSSVGWKFLWYKYNGQPGTLTSTDEHSKTISWIVSYVGRFKYYCRAQRGNYHTHYSEVAEITVLARPKAVASIKPDPQVFVGETVTLRCDIQGSSVYRWQYSWKKEGSEKTISSEQEYNIGGVKDYHEGEFTCRGTEAGGSRYSHTSDAVRLIVSVRPKPSVTVQPQSSVYTGDIVTLSCNIQSSVGWKFLWYKYNGQPGTLTSTDEHSKTISWIVSYVGRFKYYCRAQRGNYHTHYSEVAEITVLARPKAVASIKPDPQVFVGETVTLRCDIQGSSVYRWQYSWKKEGSEKTISSEQEYNIGGVKDYHEGEFTCRGTEAGGSRYSHTSDAVRLIVSVRPKPSVTVQPQSSVYTGDIVTLSCNIQSSVGWKFLWYKYNRQPGTLTSTDEHSKTISWIMSYVGRFKYYCRAQRGNYHTHYSEVAEITVLARPKAVASIKPDPQVFVGETVTLRCDIQGSSVYRWQYSWKKEGSEKTISSEQEYNIGGVKDYHEGEFTCRGTEAGGSRYSHTSDAVRLIVSVRPKPSVTVQPQSSVYTGDIVTLSCNIQSSVGWKFLWYKYNRQPGTLTSTDEHSKTISWIMSYVGRFKYYCRAQRGNYHTHYSEVAEITVLDYHEGEFTCRGTEAGGSRYSHTSDAVTLTISAVKPKPELTSSPQGAALMGNPVTLYCKLEQSAGWRFHWSKHTQNPENETNTATRSYTISAVKLSDGGQYWCRAGRGNPVYYTHYSDALWVNITGVSSLVSLIIIPNRTQHFSGHSLSLSCEDQRNSTTWRVMQYTQNRSLSNCPPGKGSVTRSTCNISSLSTSHTGVYWCQSKSLGSSKPVNITVHDGDVILDSPVHPVTEGDSLTLRCLLNKTSSNLISYFYKDGSLFWNQTTGQITIPVISKSDEGLYYCEYPERRESPQSWVSVRDLGPGSSGVIVGPAVGFSLILLLIIILILFLSYKKNKGGTGSRSPPTGRQENTSQTTAQRQSWTGPESSLAGTSLLQAGGDLIYANVGNRITDAGAGPSDVTYAQIKMKPKKKPKQTEKTREGTDVMYSELKQKSENDGAGPSGSAMVKVLDLSWDG
ncbi:titin-like isoform X2 [Electrophorus electricus]|uniref:titin-like isoform X2 n=1 Tax=Electrophorus electricus TaxID=8005 RepID=UPI0015CFF0DB|nr:titin-like isoform X2 [Electrophorus electricus]